jgi:hypothetical protein|tara:strand:- start:552 stop:809 length:258 start_codon:yes stop_codon:yes gene_type:complete
MEIILTVLITLLVVALIGAGISLVRLNNKVQDVEVLRRDVEYINQELISRIDGWVSSTDRRFDKLWDEVGRLDSEVNPNKDILKG